MNNEPNDYNNDMEHPMSVRETLSTEIIHALDARDGDLLLLAIESAELSEALDVMALRVQLRSLWLDAKNDLARVSSDGIGNVEQNAKAMFENIDNHFADIATDSEANVTGSTNALVDELSRLEAPSRVTFVEAMANIDELTLDKKETLLPWVFEWRNKIVETVWSVVQEVRESGDTPQNMERFSQVMMDVNGTLDKLARGATRPGEVR